MHPCSASFTGRDQFQFNIPRNLTDDLSALNHYQLLDVHFGASAEEVRKAYRHRARQLHPDKNPDISEEVMKQVNEAYHVLSDTIQRAEYDEKLQEDGDNPGWRGDPIGSLTQGRQPSQEFMKLFHAWKNENRDSGIGQFEETLKKYLQVFLRGPLSKQLHLPQHTVKSQSQNPSKDLSGGPQLHLPQHTVKSQAQNPSPLNELLQAVKAESLQPAATVKKQKATAVKGEYKIAELLRRMRTTESRLAIPSDGSQVPILDLSNASNSDLNVLLGLFTANDQSRSAKTKVSRETSLKSLSEYIPNTRVQTPSYPPPFFGEISCGKCKNLLHWPKVKYLCFTCANSFCYNCLVKNKQGILLPRFRQTELQHVCESCNDRLLQKDMEDWTEAGLRFLKGGTLGQVRAALGCFTMALMSYPQSSQPAFQLARELVNQKLHEIAIPVVASLQEQCEKPKEKLRAYMLMASAMQGMATQPDLSLDEQHFFLMAAKECYNVSEGLTSKMNSTDVPELVAKSKELDSAVKAIMQKNDCDQYSQAEKLRRQMEQAWETRDYQQLLTLVTAERSHSNIAIHSNPTLEALRKFLAGKEKFLERMLPEDRFPLIFLQGLVKLYDGKFCTGLADIESAAWGGHCGRWLTKAIIGAVLALLATHYDQVFPFHAFCENFSTIASSYGIRDSASHCLLPSVEELTPPSKLHWPGLGIEGLNTNARRKYEQAVARKLESGEWAEQNAALAYIDLAPACEHPAEVVVCYITAGLWFLKELRSKATGSTSSSSELYAQKKAILHCLKQAYIISILSLHPGMQLYVCRVALGAALSTTQLVGRLATPEDSEFVVQLLSRLIYNCRFCSFWHPPVVMVSEAVLLNIIAGRFHSEFLLGLQTLHPDQCPVSLPELRYQLYENDLRFVRRLQDHKGALARAMEAMLQERGWSWEDVTKLMSSPLTARTTDGWLIQQPRLSTQLEYGELKGFVLDLDKPSIELLVEPSRVGLFSQSDVDTVLRLDDKVFPVFFSLDPPSKDQHFHPFQKLRYSPEKLEGTEFLHTLLETDYLLKSFSVGSDVSAKPPFNQRPCSEGLTSNLPEHLRHALRRVSERGRSLSHINRFWIQADELVYSSEQSGSRLVFYLGKPKMAIHTHQILPGPDGKLQDTEEDDDPESPEAKFAADLTTHYDELAQHFPVFARLRELCKLQFFGFILNNVLKDMKKKAEGPGIQVSDQMLREVQQPARQQQSKLADGLREMKQQIGVWPAADDYSEVSSAVRAVQRDIPEFEFVSYSDIEPHIKTALRTKDANVLSQVVDALMECSQNRVLRSTLEGHVRSWLDNRSSTDDTLQSYSWLFNQSSADDALQGYSGLSNRSSADNLINLLLPLPTRDDVRQVVIQHCEQRYQNFHRVVSQLKAADQSQGTIKKNPCEWVPAAMHKEESSDGTFVSLCYGGVLMAPEYKEGHVPSSPRAHLKTLSTDGQRTPLSQANRFSQQTRPFSTSTAVSAPADAPLSAAASTEGARGGGGKRNGRSSKSGKSYRHDESSKSDRSTEASADGRPAAGGAGDGSGGDSSDDGGSSDEMSEPKSTWPFNFEAPSFRYSEYIKRLLSQYRSLGTSEAFQQVCHSLLQAVARQFEELSRTCDPSIQISEAKAKLYPGPGPCNAPRCKTCDYYSDSQSFTSTSTKKTYPILGNWNCKTKGVIYLVTCKKTNKQYVGLTKRRLCKRNNEHRKDIRNRVKALGEHFGDNIKNMSIQIIDQSDDINELKVMEACYIQILGTHSETHPETGLNRDLEEEHYDPNYAAEKVRQLEGATADGGATPLLFI